MSEFTEPSDELKRVAEEIRLLRSELQNASGALGRIERRLKVAFPNYPSKPREPKGKVSASRTISSKTPQELKSLFDTLVTLTQDQGDGAFAARVAELTDGDVVALAAELGIASRSKLSRPKATDGIRKRVQEAIMLQFKKKESA